MRESLTARFAPADRGVTLRATSTSALEMRGPFPAFAGALPRYFLRNVTAGMLDGDDYAIGIHLTEGARVTVAPTSAAKVFVSRGAGALLATTIEVERGAILDFDAGLTIPHAGAVARQATAIVLHEGARIAYADTFAFGRIAHGERFAFDRFESSLRVRTQTGLVRYSRRSVLVPSEQRGLLNAAVGTAGVLGSLLLLGAGDRPELPEVEGAYAGTSALPHGIGWQVQVLAARHEQSERVLSEARTAWIASHGLAEVKPDLDPVFA